MGNGWFLVILYIFKVSVNTEILKNTIYNQITFFTCNFFYFKITYNCTFYLGFA